MQKQNNQFYYAMMWMMKVGYEMCFEQMQDVGMLINISAKS